VHALVPQLGNDDALEQVLCPDAPIRGLIWFRSRDASEFLTDPVSELSPDPVSVVARLVSYSFQLQRCGWPSSDPESVEARCTFKREYIEAHTDQGRCRAIASRFCESVADQLFLHRPGSVEALCHGDCCSIATRRLHIER